MTIDSIQTIYDIGVGTLADRRLVIFAAHELGVSKSFDLGGSWSSPWTGGMATAVGLSPNFEKDGLIVVGVTDGVVGSNDWGETWNFRAFPDSGVLVASLAIRASSLDRRVMLAGCVDDGFYRSTDEGATWRSSNAGAYIPRVTTVLMGDELLWMAGTDGGLFASANDGLTWDDEVADQIDAEVTALSADTDLLVMGTASDGVFGRLRDHDPAWIRFPESQAHEEIVAVAVMGNVAEDKSVVVVGRNYVDQYRAVIENQGLSMELLRSYRIENSLVRAVVFRHRQELCVAVVTVTNRVYVLQINVSGVSPVAQNASLACRRT